MVLTQLKKPVVIGSERVLKYASAGRIVRFEAPEELIGRSIDLVATSVDGTLETLGTITTATMNPCAPDSPLALEISVPAFEKLGDEWTLAFAHGDVWVNYRLVRHGGWAHAYGRSLPTFKPEEPYSFHSGEALIEWSQLESNMKKFHLLITDPTPTGERVPHDDVRVATGYGAGIVTVSRYDVLDLMERMNMMHGTPLSDKARWLNTEASRILAAVGWKN